VCELASSRRRLLSSRARIQVDRERGRRVMGCVQLKLVRAAGHTVGNECIATQLTKQFLSCTSFRLDATHARLAMNTTFNFVHCQSISTVLRSSDHPRNPPKTLAGCAGRPSLSLFITIRTTAVRRCLIMSLYRKTIYYHTLYNVKTNMVRL
jgi:hypothetical protein